MCLTSGCVHHSETTVDLQVRALMFIQCGVLWFCYIFTLFYVSRKRDLAKVGASCHRGTQLRCRRGSRADHVCYKEEVELLGCARNKRVVTPLFYGRS